MSSFSFKDTVVVTIRCWCHFRFKSAVSSGNLSRGFFRCLESQRVGPSGKCVFKYLGFSAGGGMWEVTQLFWLQLPPNGAHTYTKICLGDKKHIEDDRHEMENQAHLLWDIVPAGWGRSEGVRVSKVPEQRLFWCDVVLESSLLIIYVVIIALNVCKVVLGSPTQAGWTIPVK